jgi:hypothetical protein
VAERRFRPQIELQLTRIAPWRCGTIGGTVRRTDEDLDIGMRIPGEVAHESAMISPTIPI